MNNGSTSTWQAGVEGGASEKEWGEGGHSTPEPPMTFLNCLDVMEKFLAETGRADSNFHELIKEATSVASRYFRDEEVYYRFIAAM